MSTETPTQSPAQPKKGICLACSVEVPLAETGAVGRHAVEREQNGNHAGYAEKFGGNLIVCIGSGHTQRHDDGHDEARLFGIRHCAHAQHEALTAQVKMNGLEFARGLDYAGTHALVHNALAALWREFAIHGQWPTGVREALRYALVEHPSSDPMRQAIQHCQALAGRQWLREAKFAMQRHYAETGVPADDFTDMLFGV